jgi:hypothetical protein
MNSEEPFEVTLYVAGVVEEPSLLVAVSKTEGCAVSQHVNAPAQNLALWWAVALR